MIDGAPPFDLVGTFTRLVTPVAPIPLDGGLLWVVVALYAVMIALVARAGKPVGLEPAVVVALLLAAPAVAHEEVSLFEPRPQVTLAVNFAGFLLPALLSVWLLASGRAPVVRTALAVAVSTGVCFAFSYAIPSEGVLLYYRTPALVAGAAGALLAWGAWEKAGPIAYVAGATGVIVGADLFHLEELMTPDSAHRIIIGGAGVLDGIFLVALLSVVVAAFARAVAVKAQRLVDVARGRDEAPAPASAAGSLVALDERYGAAPSTGSRPAGDVGGLG